MNDLYTVVTVLLILGIIFFVLSFILPERKKNKNEEKEAEERIKAFLDEELKNAREKIDDMADESAKYSVEKTERALEKLSNEKIMAVDEYSETVLKKINDNHNEAVFLYDMLNDKDEKLKTTGEEIAADKEALITKERELKVAEEKLKDTEIKLLQEQEKNKEIEDAIEQADSFTPFTIERVELKEEEKTPKAKPEKKDGTSASSKEKPKAKTSSKKSGGKNPEVSVHFDADKDGRKNSNEMIRKLHEEGKSNMAIARELGLGVGEVKLVIDLFSTKNS